MHTNYNTQDRGDKQSYQMYLEAMDAIAVEKVASASSFFEPQKGNTIVDVGMASGTSSAILAQLFPDLFIIGVDINQKMVDIATETYKQPNLSFRTDDGEKLKTFEKNSVNGFFNCSSIHHITSYNGYDNNHAIRTLERQAELLRERGMLVVRDFVKPEEKEILLELSTINNHSRPSDSDLFIQFANSARSLALPEERGFPYEEMNTQMKNRRIFRVFYSDAVEFIRRKDYFDNWEIELQEEYGYLTQREFEDTFHNLGLRIIISAPIYNPWIINNRYKGLLRLLDLSGNEIGFPPTNYLIAGEKTLKGKQLHPVRHLPSLKEPFLRYATYQNKENGQFYDLAMRPNEVTDIIPYYKNKNRIIVLAKNGYPRPLITAKTESAILDGKHFGGYITEGLTAEKKESIETIISQRFNIKEDNYSTIEKGLSYFPSPGGIDEKVSSMFIELSDCPNNTSTLESGYSGFRESGFIHTYDAIQLLNTAQTGALAEARLELNIYYLLQKNKIKLSSWLGEKINLKTSVNLEVTGLNDLLDIRNEVFSPVGKKASFLEIKRTCFAEIGIIDSQSILEYVYPTGLSSNTLLTLPATKYNGEIYIGLEMRDLPVPQMYNKNSTLLTAPAKRLPFTIKNIADLQKYLIDMHFGYSHVESYFRLGEKYYPSIGITTEQVYPYVVCLNKPSEGLHWVSLDELIENFPRLEDAHLMISLFRLKHALLTE